jgi:TolB-like protein
MGVAAAIAVLPFENPSGDPQQAYFARGFVEELVTELSRFPALEVIHPSLGESGPG